MRLQRIAIVALLLVVAETFALAADKREQLSAVVADKAFSPTAHPDSSHWQDLFAADLSNVMEPKSGWAWQNGELITTGGATLLTKDQYANYILDLEFKNGPGANSGVFIYCSDLKNWIPYKIEIQILDDYSPKNAKVEKTQLCGAIYSRQPPLKQTVKQAGQWNRMTLWCLGSNVSVMLNGELVSKIDMRQWTSGKKTPDGLDIPLKYNIPLAQLPTRGHIGLQGKHGETPNWFRNVKIKTFCAEDSPERK